MTLLSDLGDRSSDAKDPDATGEGADSEAKAEQGDHQAGRRLALFRLADLEAVPIGLFRWQVQFLY